MNIDEMKTAFDMAISPPGKWRSIRNIEYFYKEDLDKQYLSFQATGNFKDWVTDFFFFPTFHDKYLVHAGYLLAFRGTLADILRDININPYKSLIISGYSMGGALSILWSWSMRGCIKTTAYTFATPNLFLGPVPEAGEIYNIQIKGDPVVILPPFYRNPGGKVIIDKSHWSPLNHQAPTYKYYIERM